MLKNRIENAATWRIRRVTKENEKIPCKIPEGNRASGLAYFDVRQIPNKFVILELCHVVDSAVEYIPPLGSAITLSGIVPRARLSCNPKESFLIHTQFESCNGYIYCGSSWKNYAAYRIDMCCNTQRTLQTQLSILRCGFSSSIWHGLSTSHC